MLEWYLHRGLTVLKTGWRAKQDRGAVTIAAPGKAVVFSDMEILALKDFAQDRRLRPDTLGPTVVTLAMLGGYLNRNNDRPPGHQKIWEGYVRLATMGGKTHQVEPRLMRPG